MPLQSRRSSVDRRIAATLFVLCVVVYAYFFQGTGWNQNAHFDTTRAIVEQGSFEITEYANNTGDVSRAGARIFSNKPPGLPLLGVPVYWLARTIERIAGVDPLEPQVVIVNMQLTTITVCAIPGALVICAIYLLFRREHVTTTNATLLALSLAFGSLIWPYAGVMMSHLAVAACLIWAWLLISDRSPSPRRASLVTAGALAAFAAMCDYFVAPLVALFLACVIARRARVSECMLFIIGPIIGAMVIALINYRSFDQLLATTYSFEDEYFKKPNMLFGQFHWPQWIRLYWITYHRMRGLFVCCPMFAIPILSLVALRRSSILKIERIVPLLIVCYFVTFMLTFLGWTGGASVGPRYLVPALPFLWLYARWGFERYRAISLALVALSIWTMLAVTCVQVLYPANDSGPPQHWDPVSSAWLAFVRGQFARWPDSYNLGMKIGLHGFASLVPLVVIVGIFSAMLRRYLLSADRAESSAADAQRLYIAPDGCNPSSASSDLNSRDSGVIST